MKKLLLLLIIGVSSCGSDKEKSAEEQVKESVLNFITKTNKSNGLDVIIDSIAVLSIDSITQKDALIMKAEYYVSEHSIKSITAKDLQDVYDIGRGLYSEDIQKINKEKAENAKSDVEYIANKYYDLVDKINVSDSVNFKYYKSNIKVFAIENGSLSSVELPFILTKRFIVVLPKDVPE